MRFRTWVALAGLALLGGCSSHPTDNNSLPPAHDIGIQKNAMNLGAAAFSPPTFTISLATQTTVKWYNGDFGSSSGYGGTNGTAHRMVSDDGTTFGSGNIPPKGSFVATLSSPGTFAYHCSIHPSMTGTVVVNP
ncbi:MAG: hypothetical protein ABI613_10560 [Gemmatimonadota bacterium]